MAASLHTPPTLLTHAQRRAGGFKTHTQTNGTTGAKTDFSLSHHGGAGLPLLQSANLMYNLRRPSQPALRHLSLSEKPAHVSLI